MGTWLLRRYKRLPPFSLFFYPHCIHPLLRQSNFRFHRKNLNIHTVKFADWTLLKLWDYFFPTIFFTWSLGMSVLPQLLMHFMGTRLQFSRWVWKKWNIFLIQWEMKKLIMRVCFGLKVLRLDLIKENSQGSSSTDRIKVMGRKVENFLILTITMFTVIIIMLIIMIVVSHTLKRIFGVKLLY